MKLITTILICLLAFFEPVKAQVPGYLGKRFYVSYDFHGFPILSTQKSFDGRSVFNTRHALSADYVISRNTAFGLHGGYFRTALEVNFTIYPYLPEDLK